MKIRTHYIRSALLYFVLLMAAGCATYNLREAQDHFNKGSEMELRAMDCTLISDNPEALPGDALAALNEYRIANRIVAAAIDKNTDDLKKDQLLGVAYVLEAMTLWRISDLEGNPLTSNESPSNISKKQQSDKTPNSRQELLSLLNQIDVLKNNNEITLGTRDMVLHKALYGFYDHDGGRAEMDYLKARTWFNSAYDQLKASVKGDGVLKFHPVRIYIGSAQLRTLAAWNVALHNNELNCGEDKNCKKASQADREALKTKTKETVCSLQPFWGENDKVKESLRRLLAPIGLPGYINSSICNE